MTRSVHKIYLGSMVLITMITTIYIAYVGFDYYGTPLSERFYHPRHDWFKSSGLFGHGLGIIGTLLILFGVIIYILHKRYRLLGNLIRLKYLLEFHIFLCTLGPVLIVFHTTFKFGGIVSIAFWSMLAVVLSGVIGRFIYLQIPRSIEGRALGLNEAKSLRTSIAQRISDKIASKTGSDDLQLLTGHLAIKRSEYRRLIKSVKLKLRQAGLGILERTEILGMIREEYLLAGRIQSLKLMQRLFSYWHVAHLPFALIMLLVVVLHIGVSLTFGYTWIF